MGREVKRVPVDFDHPLDEIWPGYTYTEAERERFREDDCSCENGWSARGHELHQLWYGYIHFEPYETGSEPFTVDTPEVRAFAERNVRGSLSYYVREGASEERIEQAIIREAHRLLDHWNGMWSHHLSQADVDALVEGNRLYDFTRTFTPGEGWRPDPSKPHPTAEQVNRWSLVGFGHDSINAHVAISARCDREGVPHTCERCGGHGSLERFPGQRAEAEAWKPTEPPTGDGWQLWETVSEGSPISPVFDSPEGLARWMSSPEYTWGAARPMAYSAALAFVRGPGWAPSLIGDAGGLHEGSDYVGTREVLAEIESGLES